LTGDVLADARHPLLPRDQRGDRRNALVQKQVADLGLFRRHADGLADRGREILVVAKLAERRVGLVPLRLVAQVALIIGGEQVAHDRWVDAA